MDTQISNAVTMQQMEQPEGFARNFVSVIHEYGADVLRTWLEKNGAPAEIKDLAEGLNNLACCMDTPGELVGVVDAELLADGMAKISRAMHFTGAEMTSPGSICQI
jgi:hypothetical protein